LNKKGQTAIEVILIAVILLGLMLGTAVISVQRNIEANKLAAIQRDTVKCQGIASTITNFNSAELYSKTSLQGLDKIVRVEKGSLVIGSVSCRYIGSASIQTSAVPDYDDDETGFDLLVGKVYSITKEDQGVVFCDKSQAWC